MVLSGKGRTEISRLHSTVDEMHGNEQQPTGALNSKKSKKWRIFSFIGALEYNKK